MANKTKNVNYNSNKKRKTVKQTTMRTDLTFSLITFCAVASIAIPALALSLRNTIPQCISDSDCTDDDDDVSFF